MSILQHVLADPLIHRFGCGLLHFLWQGIAIAAIALMAAWVLRRASSSIRYWIYVAALTLMAICPPVTFMACPVMKPVR